MPERGVDHLPAFAVPSSQFRSDGGVPPLHLVVGRLAQRRVGMSDEGHDMGAPGAAEIERRDAFLGGAGQRGQNDQRLLVEARRRLQHDLRGIGRGNREKRRVARKLDGRQGQKLHAAGSHEEDAFQTAIQQIAHQDADVPGDCNRAALDLHKAIPIEVEHLNLPVLRSALVPNHAGVFTQ